MMWKAIGVAAIIPLAITMSGCAAPSPESCRIDRTGTTIAAGVIGGAVLAAGIAAVAHSNSGAVAAIGLAGALVGGVVGAIVAHERDKACHDLALKEALDQAVAVNEGIQSRTPAIASESPVTPEAQDKVDTKPAAVVIPQTTEPLKYQTVAWANSMTNHAGSITPLVAATDSPKDQVCMTYADQQLVDGKMQTLTGKACRASDGKWKTMGS
jgi:surface antigen